MFSAFVVFIIVQNERRKLNCVKKLFKDFEQKFHFFLNVFLGKINKSAFAKQLFMYFYKCE